MTSRRTVVRDELIRNFRQQGVRRARGNSPSRDHWRGCWGARRTWMEAIHVRVLACLKKWCLRDHTIQFSLRLVHAARESRSHAFLVQYLVCGRRARDSFKQATACFCVLLPLILPSVPYTISIPRTDCSFSFPASSLLLCPGKSASLTLTQQVWCGRRREVPLGSLTGTAATPGAEPSTLRLFFPPEPPGHPQPRSPRLPSPNGLCGSVPRFLFME